MPNHAKICLYYYPQKVCNFHIYVFQIKFKLFISHTNSHITLGPPVVKRTLLLNMSCGIHKLKRRQYDWNVGNPTRNKVS